MHRRFVVLLTLSFATLFGMAAPVSESGAMQQAAAFLAGPIVGLSDLFETFFDALYWATISITTIGYGDIYPTTDIGRFITMISALVGVAVIALPSGMITAAYMNEISKKKSKYEL